MIHDTEPVKNKSILRLSWAAVYMRNIHIREQLLKIFCWNLYLSSKASTKYALLSSSFVIAFEGLLCASSLGS